LNVLDIKVNLGAGFVVGTHDSNFLASSDGTTEHTTEGEETTIVTGWDHLGNVDHKRTSGVTLCDWLSGYIINGTFVEVSSSVSLGLSGGRKLHDDHFKKSFSSIDPLLVDTLHQKLALKTLLIILKGDAEGVSHLPDGVVVSIHDVSHECNDWLHDKLDEATRELGAIISSVIGSELLLAGVEVVFTPEFLHELVKVEFEFTRVDTSEAGQSKGPTEKSRTEGDCSIGGINLLSLTHVFTLVGWDDDVGVLDDTLEVLIHVLTIDLELKDTAIYFVDEQNGLDLLTKSLTEYSLGLDANTFDVIDDDKCTVSDTKGSGDFSGEVDVSGGVDKVDEVRLSVHLVYDIGFEVKWHTCWFDGDTTFLFIGTGVSGTHISSLIAGNDTGFGNKGVSKGRLAVIDVSDNRHVADVVRLTHDFSNLVNCEVWHVCVWSVKTINSNNLN
jgi:hypothetical protein